MASSKSFKNPYVHPDPDKGMLNQASNDGWSFDEYDDEDKPTPKIVKPGETPWLTPAGSSGGAETTAKEQAALAAKSEPRPGSVPMQGKDTQAFLAGKFDVPGTVPGPTADLDPAKWKKIGSPDPAADEKTQAFLDAKSRPRPVAETVEPVPDVKAAEQAFLSSKFDGPEAAAKAAENLRQAMAADPSDNDRGKMAERAFGDLLREAGEAGQEDEHGMA